MILLPSMKKQIYLISGIKGESYGDFKGRVMENAEAAAILVQDGSLRITLTVEPPPLFSIIPFKKKKIAAISMVSDLDGPSDILVNAKGLSGIYTVDEALPVSYRKTWKNREITPGVCLLTLFRKKTGLDQDTFLDRWHHSHTPLSLRIHPLWHYNRNVVKEVKSATDLPWDGIVEEHFRTKADLINPFLFFGNPLVIFPNMLEVYRDTRSFLEYGTIEPYLVREYHICS